MGVNGGVPLHELPLSKRLGSACLEGEIGEVIVDEHKTLLCWFCPNMAMIVSPEKPQTNTPRPVAPVRTLG
jgi:hypothetical protein